MIKQLLAVLVCLPLMACFGPDGGGGALGFLASGTEREDVVARDVMRSVELFGGEIVVRGPAGYCIDRKSLRRSEQMSFVLLASCEALSGVRGQAVEPAVLTLTVMPGQGGVSVPDASEIAGSHGEAKVLAAIERDNLTMVHLSRGGEGVLPDGDPRHWRGATVLNSHLIGLAVYARAGNRKAGADGKILLDALAGAVRKASPRLPQAVTAAEEDTPKIRQKGPSTLLGGLFPGSG